MLYSKQNSKDGNLSVECRLSVLVMDEGTSQELIGY